MDFPAAVSAASASALELGTLKPTETKVVLEQVGDVDVVIRIFTHQKAKVSALMHVAIALSVLLPARVTPMGSPACQGNAQRVDGVAVVSLTCLRRCLSNSSLFA